jgi:hypothetical protein
MRANTANGLAVGIAVLLCPICADRFLPTNRHAKVEKKPSAMVAAVLVVMAPREPVKVLLRIMTTTVVDWTTTRNGVILVRKVAVLLPRAVTLAVVVEIAAEVVTMAVAAKDRAVVLVPGVKVPVVVVVVVVVVAAVVVAAKAQAVILVLEMVAAVPVAVVAAAAVPETAAAMVVAKETAKAMKEAMALQVFRAAAAREATVTTITTMTVMETASRTIPFAVKRLGRNLRFPGIFRNPSLTEPLIPSWAGGRPLAKNVVMPFRYPSRYSARYLTWTRIVKLRGRYCLYLAALCWRCGRYFLYLSF